MIDKVDRTYNKNMICSFRPKERAIGINYKMIASRVYEK